MIKYIGHDYLFPGQDFFISRGFQTFPRERIAPPVHRSRLIFLRTPAEKPISAPNATMEKMVASAGRFVDCLFPA